jgi:hypothetical protein
MRLRNTALILITALLSGTVAVPGQASAAPPLRRSIAEGAHACPAGYACLWEHDNYRGRGVAFYGTERSFRGINGYSWIHDQASSAANNGTSGRFAVFYADNDHGGLYSLLSPREHCGSADSCWATANLGELNDTLSSMRWEGNLE